MTTAVDAKLQAAQAWDSGNYERAAEMYGAAITLADAGDKDFLKTIYSNRSAAYMKLGRNSAALSDANKCIEIDSTWAKGHTRKGDANYALGRFTESYNAYNAGLRIAPNDSVLKEKVEIAMRAIRGPEQPAGATAGTTAGATGGSTGILKKVSGALKTLVVVDAVLFLLPIGKSLNALNYKVFAVSAMADYAIGLYSAHGMPQFNTAYAQRILPDPTAMYFFLSVILLMGRPYLTAMMPIFLLEFSQWAYFVSEEGRHRFPALLDRASGVIDKFLPSALGIDGWAQLSAPSKWTQVNQKVVSVAATAEVMQGLFLVFELFFPTRNFIFLFMWWQFLQMRFMLDQSGTVKRAFWTLDERVSSLLQHRLCPEAVRMIYGKLKEFLAKQVKLPEPGAPPPSLMSKCCIS